MSLKQRDARHLFSNRSLVLGFSMTLALAVVTLSYVVVEFGRAQQDTMMLAEEGQRGTYYLGDVGEQIARLGAQISLGRQETHDEFASRAELLARIETSLQNDIDGLGLALGSRQADSSAGQKWTALRADVNRLRRAYADAASLIRTGQPQRAAELLSRHASLATTIHEGLDQLVQAHRQAMLEELKLAQRRASLARVLAITAGGVFVLAMCAIWAVVLRRLGRQGSRLVTTNVRLESVNADLDAFAGRVAHDLKNALGPVMMAPSMLRRSPADTARVLDVADRTERCSRRAIAVVDALLAFSRASRDVEAGESGALQSAVNDVLEELAPLATKLAVSIEAEDIPDLHVRCSPGLLHILLANLAGNAVKYLEGQPERRVRIAVSTDDSMCRIEVSDTGPGIPKHSQEKIFQPFYRVEGVRAPGTGIGLATVRRIVDARGGRVGLESAEGAGSRFTVWLPCASPPAEQLPTPRPERRISAHH